MRKLIVFAIGILCLSCSGGDYKYELDENLTYKDYVDESLLKNEAVNSMFLTVGDAMESLTNNVIDVSSAADNVNYKATQIKTETVSDALSNVFSSGADVISMTSDALSLEADYNSVIEQVRILHSLHEDFNTEKADLLSSNFKEFTANVYPMKYLLLKDDFISLNLKKPTIKAWKSNPKLDPYFIDQLVPAYYEMMSDYTKLRKTLGLNKVSQEQLNELVIQLKSDKDEDMVFRDTRSISNFKDSYAQFMELADLKNPAIANEVEFLNDKSIKVLENSINKMTSNSDELFKMLEGGTTTDFKSVMSSYIKVTYRKEFNKMIRKI